MDQSQLTRRNLLGAAATVAPRLCTLHQPATSRRGAWDQLIATLNDEQIALLIRIDANHTNGWIDEQLVLVEDLKRHAPAFAAMIELTYEHVADQRVALRGRCCTGTPVEGEYRYV